MLTKYETDHHIQPGTLAKIGWSDCFHDSRPAIQFQTATGPRWRFMDGKKPKYDHPVGYQACWYGLKRAVAKGLDFIVDCNGAASTIAADQHGLPAYSLQSGETTKPKPELLEELKSLWTGKVYVAFDCDAPGKAGATKRVQAYHEAGIDAVALDLALDIDGGDLADFVGLHGAGSVQALTACKLLVIPDKPKPKAKQHKATSYADWDIALDAIRSRLSCYDFMCQRYGDPKKHGRSYGHWLAIQRIEDSPSFAAYMETGGFFDYGSGDAGDIFDLIRLADKCDFITAVKTAADLTSVTLPERKVVTEVVTPPEPAKVAEGLPISIRTALNLYAAPQIGAVVELWQEVIDKGHCQSTDEVSADYLICEAEMLGRYISSHTIRIGLNQGCGQFFRNRLRIDPITKEDSGSDNLVSESTDKDNQDSCNKHAGRKPELYTLKPLTEIVQVLTKLAIVPLLKAEFPADDPMAAPICAEFLEELGLTDADDKANALKDRYSDKLAQQPGFKKKLARARKVYAKFAASLYQRDYAPIAPDRKFANHREYVAECARALIAKSPEPTQYSRPELCRLIGCRDRELPAIFKRGGLVMLKDQYLEREIDTLNEFKAIQGDYDFDRKGKPEWVTSSLDKQRKDFGGAGTAYWLEKQFYAGAVIKVQYHQANRQAIAPEVEPAPIPVAAPVVEPEPELTQKPLLEVTDPGIPTHFWHVWWCVFIFERIYSAMCIIWCFLRDLKRVVEHKLTYAESWLNKVVAVATPWQADGDRLVERITGEIQPASVQLSFDLLLADPSPG
jgi:hypothetical protein